MMVQETDYCNDGKQATGDDPYSQRLRNAALIGGLYVTVVLIVQIALMWRGQYIVSTGWIGLTSFVWKRVIDSRLVDPQIAI